MTRLVTYRMAKALKAGAPIALFGEVQHPDDGMRRFWTGIGPIDWNGYTWTGCGSLGTITPVKFSSDLAIQEIQFVMTGLNPERDDWATAQIRNLAGNAWLACLGENGEVVPDPLQVVQAILDYPRVNVDERGMATTALCARAGFYTLERAMDEVFSSEDQKRRYPDDTGCDLITDLQQQDVIWTPT